MKLHLVPTLGEILLAVSVTDDLLDCRGAELLLHLAVDGEIDLDDRRAFEAHIAVCDDCRARLRLHEATRAKLRSKESAIDVPPQLLEKIRGAIEAEKKPRPRVPVALAFGVAVFAVLGVAALVGLSFGQDSTPSRTIAEAPRAAGSTAKAIAAASNPVTESVARHALDVPVDVASPDPRVVEAFLRARVGIPLVVPRLDVHGYGLRGGRVVAVQKRRAAQLVYDGGLGKRVSIVIVPDADGSVVAQYPRQKRGPGAAVASTAFDVIDVHHASERGFDVRLIRQGKLIYAVVGPDAHGAAALKTALQALPTDVDATTAAQ